MAVTAVTVSLFCILFLQGVYTIQWSSSTPPDMLAIYACTQDTITIPWEYILGTGDSVGEISWLYDGHSQEIIAIFTHGMFLPTPAFSHRVLQVGNAGLTVQRVLVGDSGNYTVEIQVFQQPNTHDVLKRTVFLRVHDRLMTNDGSLHAFQGQEAVLDPNTGQFAIELLCGAFTFNENLPFYVEWVTPSGKVVNSTNFQDHHFRLLLQNPIQGGNFTCRIPSHLMGEACLHGNAGHQAEASVNVDKVEARLSLLEKENQALKEQLHQTNSSFTQENQLLKNQLSETTTKLVQTNTSLTQENELLKSQLQQTNSELSKANSTLTHSLSDQEGRLVKLEDAARHQVAFHATYLQSTNPPSGTPLIFSTIHYNIGNAYSSSTGYFSAPFGGIYFVIATTGGSPPGGTGGAWHSLYVDYARLGYGYTYSESTHTEAVSVHAAVHLAAGQRVWVQSHGDLYMGGDESRFSGFLISRDL